MKTFIAFLLTAGISCGCSCKPKLTVTEAFEKRASIFSGRVMKLEVVAPSLHKRKDGSEYEEYGGVKVTFLVHRTYKGAQLEEVVVQTNSTGASCGFVFNVNEDYLVYADNYQGRLLTTSKCHRTTKLSWDLQYNRPVRTVEVIESGLVEEISFLEQGEQKSDQSRKAEQSVPPKSDRAGG